MSNDHAFDILLDRNRREGYLLNVWEWCVNAAEETGSVLSRPEYEPPTADRSHLIYMSRLKNCGSASTEDIDRIVDVIRADVVGEDGDKCVGIAGDFQTFKGT